METNLKRVGCTAVTKGLTVVYYISSLDGSGREDFWGHTKSLKKIQRTFEKAKETEYDMHLIAGLVKFYKGKKEQGIDSEVMDSYTNEKEIFD